MFPYYWYEQAGADRYEAEEENDNYWMLLIHEVVSQTGATVRDPAIREEDVESTECGGDVDDEESVEEAYRGVSVKNERKNCW